jgi:hypothetical protein
VVAGDDDNLSETMLLETRRYRDIPMTKPMSIGGRNKLVRSQAAIVRAERGMMYLPELTGRRLEGYPSTYDHPNEEWVEELSDQLASFTGADGEQDDIADAVSILGRLADEFVPGEDAQDQDPVAGVGGYTGEVYDGMGGSDGLAGYDGDDGYGRMGWATTQEAGDGRDATPDRCGPQHPPTDIPVEADGRRHRWAARGGAARGGTAAER